MFHGHLIAAAADVHSHSVIFEPSIGLRLARKLTDASRKSEVMGYLSSSDGPSKTLGAGNVDSASTRSVPIQPFSVCSVPIVLTLHKDRPCVKARFSRFDWNSMVVPVRTPVVIAPGRV